MCLMGHESSVNSSALSAFQHTPFPTILPPRCYLCWYLSHKYPGFQHVQYFAFHYCQLAALTAASTVEFSNPYIIRKMLICNSAISP